MLFEVYYKNYAKNCKGKYWEEEKSLPYIVLERDVKKKKFLLWIFSIKGFYMCKLELFLSCHISKSKINAFWNDK